MSATDQEAEYFIPMDGTKYNRTDCEISNYGNIRKNGEPYKTNYTKKYGYSTKMRFNTLDDDGNLIEANKDKKTMPMNYVKHIVAYYFIPNELNYQYVLHIDNNKQNLFYKNLLWINTDEKNMHLNIKRYEAKKKSSKVNKFMIETDNMDPDNFVSIGMIQTSADTIRDFRAYSISKDGKSVLSKTGKFISKSKNVHGYIDISLIDIKKSNSDGIPMLMHKLINVVLKGGKYEDQVDHIDRDKTNNSLDNLEAVTARENSIRANGVTFYKIDPSTMQIVETYRAISESFPELKVQKMITGSFYNKRVYDHHQWRRAKDEGTFYTIQNNTIIDIESVGANNLKKVNEINELLQFQKSCLSISVFIGGTENIQTFHCSEFDLDMQMSWDNMKQRKSCYYCQGSPKFGLQRVLPVYKYSLSGEYICDYTNITDAMNNQFIDGYEPKHTAGVLKCCLEKSKTAYGHIWSFYKPTNNKLVRNLAKLDPMTLKRFKKLGLIN